MTRDAWDEIEPEFDPWAEDDFDDFEDLDDRGVADDLLAIVTPTTTQNDVMARVLGLALEFEDPVPVLRDYLHAAALLAGERTGSADPSAKAEAAVQAVALRDASTVTAALSRQVDALLGLLKSGVTT